MITIINGRKYNTETAKNLATYERQYSEAPSKVIKLLKKGNGEYFLYGDIGASPESIRGIDDYTFGIIHNAKDEDGNIIVPIKEKDAKDWVELYANDLYEDIFGPVAE